MDRKEIIRMAREAGIGVVYGDDAIERFAVALRTALAESDGWRQCAVGQKATQHCGLLEDAVKAEREACARIADPPAHRHEIAAAIRARGQVPRKSTCVYPQCVSTTRTQCEAWALGACEERQEDASKRLAWTEDYGDRE